MNILNEEIMKSLFAAGKKKKKRKKKNKKRVDYKKSSSSRGTGPSKRRTINRSRAFRGTGMNR